MAHPHNHEHAHTDPGQHERRVHPPGRKELLLSLALVLHPRHRFDVQSLRDPLPGLVDASDIVRAYCGRLRGLVAERLYLGRQRRAWRRGQVDKRLSAAGSVLFLCYGNINRSALADALLRGYAEDTGVNVFSAGFHPQVGRPPDPVMVEVAADHGVDMRELRSSTVDREMVQGSDIIFVMEKRHRDRLLEMEPGADDRIFLLGAVPGGADLTGEIGDPFGQTRESYLACFARIARAIDHIKAVLAARSPD